MMRLRFVNGKSSCKKPLQEDPNSRLPLNGSELVPQSYLYLPGRIQDGMPTAPRHSERTAGYVPVKATEGMAIEGVGDIQLEY